jgi:ATP-dependent metalloprotease FtsH
VIPHNEQVEDVLAFVLAQQGKMSQSAISMKIGVSQATVGNWQRGKHLPQAITPNLTDTILPAQVAITPELLRLFGYYTAEGRTNGSVELIFGSHEAALIADSAKIGEDIFGVRAAIVPTKDNSTRVTFYSAALGRLFAQQCGNGSYNKHIPAMLWDLSREHFLAYLGGYMLGDGYTNSDGKMIATSVSHQLIRELTWLCAMHGIKTGSRQVVSPGGRIIKAKPLPETIAWSLIIGSTSAPGSAKQAMPKRSIVRSVTKLPYDGYVYDLVGCDNEAFFGGESPLLLHNSRVRDLFDQAKRNSPCIVFVDEIDAVGRQRGAGLGGSHDEREQTLNQILVEMDGFDTNTNVIVVAATNRPDILDPALLRPGRFDRRVILDRPDMKGRLAILKVHSKGKPLDRAVDLEVIANQTPGFSGADLANLINEAAILAARHNRKVVTMPDFGEAVERIIAGPERKSRIISDVEKLIIAYHEGGHAVVQRMLPLCDPVSKVTIIGRGMALGYTMALPAEDRYLQSKAEFEDKIAGLMGGNAAEQMIFGDTTTGASNDIEKATEIARRMVTQFGMSSKLGPLAFGHKEEMVFLGRDFGDQRNYSDDVARQIDEEIKAIIERGYTRATQVLTAERSRLDALAEKLVAEETVDSAEFETLFTDVPPKSDPRMPVIPTIVAGPIPAPSPATQATPKPARRATPA